MWLRGSTTCSKCAPFSPLRRGWPLLNSNFQTYAVGAEVKTAAPKREVTDHRPRRRCMMSLLRLTKCLTKTSQMLNKPRHLKIGARSNVLE